jgi:hypothetical protein
MFTGLWRCGRGVSKIVKILRREIMIVMTSVGASTLKDFKPEMASLIYGFQVDHCLIPAHVTRVDSAGVLTIPNCNCPW